MLGTQGIALGDTDVVVAGGMEAMSRVPYLAPQVRDGLRLGNGTLVDAVIQDGLWCAFEAEHMGSGTERFVGDFGIARSDQDAFAVRSHARAVAAGDNPRILGRNRAAPAIGVGRVDTRGFQPHPDLQRPGFGRGKFAGDDHLLRQQQRLGLRAAALVKQLHAEGHGALDRRFDLRRIDQLVGLHVDEDRLGPDVADAPAT